MDFTNDDITSLGDKLAALDLTDGETEALRTIVAIAADAGSDDDEVSGFLVGSALCDEISTVRFGSLGLKLGPPTTRFSSDGGLGGTRIVNMGDDEGGVI